MLAEGKTQVFANVPEEYKERLDALKSIDKVLYSNSRVMAECLEHYLPVVERRVQSFKKPMHETSTKRTRLVRA